MYLVNENIVVRKMSFELSDRARICIIFELVHDARLRLRWHLLESGKLSRLGEGGGGGGWGWLKDSLRLECEVVESPYDSFPLPRVIQNKFSSATIFYMVSVMHVPHRVVNPSPHHDTPSTPMKAAALSHWNNLHPQHIDEWRSLWVRVECVTNL